MERYAEILFESDKGLLQAQKDLVARNEQLMKDFTAELKEAKKEKFKTDEAKSRKEDARKGESLLKQIDDV